MSVNLENLAVATGVEKVSFYSNPKESKSRSVMWNPLQPYGL